MTPVVLKMVSLNPVLTRVFLMSLHVGCSNVVQEDTFLVPLS